MPLRKSVYESEVHLPLDMEASTQPQTLKRSNAITAKLQKDKVSSVGSDDWAAGDARLSKALKHARKQDEKAEKRTEKKLEKASRQNSFEPSISDKASTGMDFHAVPMGLFAATQPKKTNLPGWSRSGATGSAEPSRPREPKTKRWGIFGRKKEDSSRPVDNFTKWDANDRERRPYAATGSAGLMVDALLDVASPSAQPRDEDESADGEHIEDIQEVRQSILADLSSEASLAAAANDTARLLDRLLLADSPSELNESQGGSHLAGKRKGRRFDAMPVQEAWNLEDERQREVPPRPLRDLDWSQEYSKKQIEELLQRLEENPWGNVSPADSDVDMGEDVRPMNKGKRRASSVSSTGTWQTVLSRGAQEELRHSQDLELYKKHILAERLEQEYQKVKQEAEDDRRARQLQEDERMARERQEEEERIAAELASRRDCICCGDEKHVLDFPAKPATDKCEHISTTCTDCMHSWLSSELDSKGCETLKCPECPSILAYDAVQLLADEPTFAKYEQLLLRNTLSSLPDFAWCLSPTCTSGQLNTENGNYMECSTCHYRQCLHHRTPWHCGETCSAYDLRIKTSAEEAATEAILDDISKKCPGKDCGWRIQKSDGCDHMTCRKCKWQFCWECLASHREIRREGNTAHERWCKFHSENLDAEGNRVEGGAVVVSWPFNAHA